MMLLLAVFVGITQSTNLRAVVPFCAVFEETNRSPKDEAPIVSVHKVCRDRNGRSRAEISAFEGSKTIAVVVFLTDPSTGRMVALDPETNMPHSDVTLPRDLSRLRPSSKPTARGGVRYPNQGSPEEEVLGEQVILGYSTHGKRETYTDGWTETWTIAELPDFPLLTRFETAEQEYIQRCTELRLEDPDPALFAALEKPLVLLP
jgi:hypothetical protein